MQLVRHNLKSLIQLSELKSAHAGLLMQRGLSPNSSKNKEESKKNIEEAKKELVHVISKIKAPEFYQLAFDRWFKLTQSENFSHVAAKVNGRLLTGLALGGALETGMTTHHTYGTPLLTGSSIKGATRAYAESIDLPADLIKDLFGSGDDQSGSDDKTSGYFVWHDAWWIPRDTGTKPFVKEVITVHEQSYYSEKTAVADGTESPIPNLQIGVQGEFYFVFEGDPSWSDYVAKLVLAMLEEQGIGAKTSSGYGYFVESTRLKKEVDDYKKAQSLGKASSDEDRIKIILTERLDKDLAEIFGQNKKRGEFLMEIELEQNDESLKLLATVLQQIKSELIEEWASSPNKNSKNAYKFIQKYLA